MLSKIRQRLCLYRKVSFFQYLYLNHFCRQVVRTDHSHILPYKHVAVDLAPGSQIILGGGDLELGCDAVKGSKAETRIRLRENGIWTNEGGCRISYGTTLEVLNGGLLDTGFFTMNSGSVIVTAQNIRLGRDVMIGRNVVIYDSDHHAIRDARYTLTNSDRPVQIGDHAWLASNVAVLKGTVLGEGCIAGANSVVHGKIPANTMYHSSAEPVLRPNYGSWSREHPIP